jgi:hypothetical protein
MQQQQAVDAVKRASDLAAYFKDQWIKAEEEAAAAETALVAGLARSKRMQLRVVKFMRASRTAHAAGVDQVKAAERMVKFTRTGQRMFQTVSDAWKRANIQRETAESDWIEAAAALLRLEEQQFTQKLAH